MRTRRRRQPARRPTTARRTLALLGPWVLIWLLCGSALALARSADGDSPAALDSPSTPPSAVAVSGLAGLEVANRFAWRSGDSLAGAAPELDSASDQADGWKTAPLDDFPADSWQGVGWFRFRLRVAPELHGIPIGVDVVQTGAAELYVDGELEHSWGVVGASKAEDVPDRTGDPRPILFHTDRGRRLGNGYVEHLVTVRYTSRFLDRLRWRGVEPQLSVRFVELRPAVERRVELVNKLSRHQMLLAGVSLAFGLVHLMLFVFRPRVGPNFFFALLALFASAHVYLNFGRFVQRDLERFHLYQTWQLLTFVAVGVASLRFVYSLIYPRRPRTFLVFLVAACGLAIWTVVTPFAAQTAAFVFLLAVNVEIVRAVVALRWSGREPLIAGAWVLGLGATPLVVLSIYQLLAGLGALPALWNFLDFPAPYYGMLVLMFAMSIYLGRDFALTRDRLERQLERVQRLSEEKLAQEQLAREKEVERARLEAENARRAAELEQARRIQMALLPRDLPSRRGLQLAVHLETAAEVGGDYYDFLESPDGELTVIVGDATGHGAQAGTVVAVTKGILRSGGDLPPRSCLETVSSGLRQIGLRRRHMALVAARFDADGRRVTLSAAAMPPVLRYRRRSRSPAGTDDLQPQVASIEFQSLPLGSLATERYEEKTLDLEPGDRLVFMSDGLPEALDDEGRPIGYARVEQAVLDGGADEPAALIARLVALTGRGTDGGAERPSDDLTLLVVAVSENEGTEAGG